MIFLVAMLVLLLLGFMNLGMLRDYGRQFDRNVGMIAKMENAWRDLFSFVA